MSEQLFDTNERLEASLEPVALIVQARCVYRSKGKGKRGCANCGFGKTHADHLGAPPSLSVMDTNAGFVYSNWKKAWTQALRLELEAAGLPRELRRVFVEGRVTFPDRRKRDQGNHRFMVEKALGDALETGGWLPEYRPDTGEQAGDSWDHYEFGGFTARYEKGVSRTELLIFATPYREGT